MPHTLHQTIQYTFGNEERYIKDIEDLDKSELEELLQFHQKEAIKAGKELAAAFTAAATGFLDNLDGDDDHGTINTSDGDSTFDDSEADSAYGTEDDSSIDEDRSDISGDDEYEHISEIDDEDDTLTEDGADSTWTNDDSEEDSTYSIDDDDLRKSLRDFHELMKKTLEHNSASCLLQFMINKQVGNENDASSLIRAMLPWTFEDSDGADPARAG